MGTTPIDYTALAKQAGAISSQPAQTQPGQSAQSAPQSQPIDYTALAKQAGAIDSQPAPSSTAPMFNGPVAQALGKFGDVSGDVASGFVKGMGDTVSGVSHLINKIPVVGESLAPSQGISALDKLDVSQGHAEAAGKGLEGIAEFAAGDELMEGLSKGTKLVALAKKYPLIAETLRIAKDNPLLAKIITTGGKAAVVGGVQGAVKGAQQDNAAEGATAGATGGAIGGAASELATPIARLFGLGGLNSTEAMIKAGRPNVNEGRTFINNVQSALPLLVEADKAAPVKTVQDFVDLAHDTANELWTNTIAPQIARHANEVIDGAPIAQRIRQALPEGTTEMFPDQAAPVESMAQSFANSKLSLSKADNYLRTLNAELKGYYQMPPANRYAAGMTNGRLAAMSEAADALRDSIYGKLEQVGEETPREFRQQYGALKQIETVFNKRATVEARQAPMNLQQVLGATEAVGALLSGHPVVASAGLIPSVARARQTSGSLIRQGLSAATRETEGAPIRSVVKKAVPNIGSQAGQAAVKELNEPDEGEE